MGKTMKAEIIFEAESGKIFDYVNAKIDLGIFWVTIEYDGKTYTIPRNRVFRIIQKEEK